MSDAGGISPGVTGVADGGPVRRVRRSAGPVDAVVEVPGSKSIANRALVCAALAVGDSVVSSVPSGDDTVAMVDCLVRLGATIELDGRTATVGGTGGRVAEHATDVHARLAGTTSRFVTAVAALGPGPTTIDGDPPLRRRPMGPLHDALGQLGATVRPGELDGCLPVTVAGPPTGERARLRGDVSSQYVSALMLIAPLLPRGLRLTLDGGLVSRPYVELTAVVLDAFGVSGVDVGDDTVHVPPGVYRAADFDVEPDASSASYPMALAAAVGGRTTVPGLGSTSVQGDARFASILADMGCDVSVTDTDTTVRRVGAVPLRGIDLDMADVSDLVPTVAALAVLAETPTRIRGVGFIRGKESDRLGDLSHELRRLGADVDVLDDGLRIEPAPLRGARLATHHDHRLAMAFGVLGAVIDGVEIEDPDVVTKSWPDFWSMLEATST